MVAMGVEMFKMQVEDKQGMEECEVGIVIAISAEATRLGNSEEEPGLGRIWVTCQGTVL